MVGLIDCLLLIGAFVALYGIYGYITQQNGVLDPGTGEFRITSVFTSAPALALFLSTLVPLAIYRALTSLGLRRLGASLVILVLLAAVALSFTRGAIISVPLSSAIAALFLPSRKLRVAAIACTATLVGLMVLVTAIGSIPILERFFQQDVGSVNGRTYLWQALLMRLDAAHLFVGYGLGASTALLTKLNIGVNGVVGNGLLATAPSNLFVGTLFDHGAVGLVLLLATLGALAATLLAGALKTRGEHRLLFSMSIAVLVNMVLLSIEQDDFWTQGIAVYFWIIMALPFAEYWVKPRQQPPAATENVQ
jgi:O-antigen ligase